MIRINAVLPENDIRKISDALKKLSLGGITVYKAKGRGKKIHPQMHASKGTEMYIPEFGERFVLEIVSQESQKDEIIEIIRSNTKIGKIFVSPVSEAIDISSGQRDDQAIG